MKLIWSDQAGEELIEIEIFVAKDNAMIAAKFIDYLIEQTQVLLQHPQIGRIVPEIGNEHIRELIIKNYRIVYRISDQLIEIITVFEGHKLLRF